MIVNMLRKRRNRIAVNAEDRSTLLGVSERQSGAKMKAKHFSAEICVTLLQPDKSHCQR